MAESNDTYANVKLFSLQYVSQQSIVLGTISSMCTYDPNKSEQLKEDGGGGKFQFRLCLGERATGENIANCKGRGGSKSI